MTSRFVDGLYELDARTTRARLTEALAAVRAHPGYANGPHARSLQRAVATVEGDLLRAARDAVSRLDAALKDADRPPVPDALDDESIPKLIRDMMRAGRERDTAGGCP
ncbi:hypothetical protein A3862_05250 [Methylobacterium sp. XJLW]|uniref:hypothetical protein n=1 Tax=Methylobacterium sp. XJLW TaxID=739141 RepID=UPI000DAAE0D4|nr:hypothetical protein [Methylobacterium sp. XJLW]AWV14989.1 hypothetical protein A3862_05250 [Methylobacterium sp. XJLW]